MGMTSISAEVIDLAYEWLCRQRRDAHHNHDVWDLRWRWETARPQLLQQLATGTYRLGTTRMVMIEGDWIEVWSSQVLWCLKRSPLCLVASGTMCCPIGAFIWPDEAVRRQPCGR